MTYRTTELFVYHVGWKVGDTVQRIHRIREDLESDTIYVALDLRGGAVSSDRTACSGRCGESLPLHSFEPIPCNEINV